MPSSSDSGSDSSDSASLPPNSLAGLSLSIFADLLSNLTHDIALQTHHTEKLLRTRQQALHPPADGSPPPTTNPLTVVPSEILCPRCHLPQHTASTLEGPSGGAKKKFCPRLPWQNAPLHDIYGNPFPTIKDKNSKNGNGADKNNNSYAATDSPAEDAPGTVVTGKKGATGAVYFKCTSCDNEKVLSSRYAVHLEKCLGLAGRKSSRAAMAKMNSNSGSGSPMLSTVDAAGPKTGSRKPSPEKKSRSPVPGLNSTDEPAMIAVPPPPKSSFHTSSAVAANTTTTTTPKKKKKKAAAVAAAAAAAAAAALATANAALPPSTPSKIDVPFIPLPPPATALVTAPQKKRKRKAEAAAAAAAATAAAAAAGDRQGSVVDEKDVSITLSATKPPPKKQKLSAERAEKAEKGEKMEKEKSMLGEGLPIKKSQVRNFKNGRGNSPSPGMGKKERRTSSPKPLASPPVTHKPLPPKPPVSLLGGPLGPAGSPSPAGTPKSRKPKPGTLGGAGSARKSGEASVKKNAKPKMKKGMNAASAGGSGAAGAGAGGAGAGKTVPRIAGKNPPGVARKGVKE